MHVKIYTLLKCNDKTRRTSLNHIHSYEGNQKQFQYFSLQTANKTSY